jgi:pyrophosphatase PpaX
MRYPTVLFDFDGTLIDSGEIILSSFRYATQTVLAQEIPDEVLAAAVGGSNIYDQMRALDEERADELVRVYREHNEPLHDELVAFDGIERLLERLTAEGRQLGIVTAKRRRTVDLGFAILPLERYFDTVVTSDQTEHHKPHPEPVLTALERLGAKPGEAAFVGDSPFDMGAGKAAGVFTIGVSWGKIHPVERLLETGADVVVHSPEELLDVL